MTDFEGTIWVAQDDDDVNVVCAIDKVKNKIQALDEKGRKIRVSEDKLLWRYPGRVQHPEEEWQSKLATLQAKVEALYQTIDVSLLWESASELQVSEMDDLADLYFGGEITTEHFTALWRAMARDRLHFKRRGKEWEPRPVEQIEELKSQRKREQARAQEQALATEWVQKLAKTPLSPAFLEEGEELQIVPIPSELPAFVGRLEAWLLRGDTDKFVEDLIKRTAEAVNLNPRELVFEILLKTGRLPPDAEREIVVAGLKPEFSTPVNEAAQAVPPWLPSETQTITELFFSIDDEETREVDDALAIERDGEAWKITIAISDPASVIHRGDVLDREAMRRGTTVYLPTQTVLMLPERMSCDIASLTAGQVRPSVVVRAWLTEAGQLMQSSITQEAICVHRRLSYTEADALMATGQDATSKHLRDLFKHAKQLQAQRMAEGAFNLQRPEFKISVSNGEIKIALIDKDSNSRLLVAEMMILGNYIAAKYARDNKVPIIYRTQEEPERPILPETANDPLAFHKVRKLLRASSLSLAPSKHSGLGLSVYTQLTSPLRRFADLVMQRQLVAHLTSEPLPYDQEELFKVLATAERTARDARLLENESKKRWFMQYLKQSWGNNPLDVLVIEDVKGGYKVDIQPWGVDAFLATPQSLGQGKIVPAMIDKIRVKAGSVRLKLVH